MKKTIDNILYTVRDLADALGKPYPTIYSRVVRGVLPEPGVTHGRSRYYSAAEFDRVVEFYESDLRLKVCCTRNVGNIKEESK